MSRKQQKQYREPTAEALRVKKISPITATQSEVFNSYWSGKHLFLYGSAGTGKTYISLYLALKDLLDKRTPYQRVHIVRSAVPSRDIGFMPGTQEQKLSVYEAPYTRMLNDLFERGDAAEILARKNLVNLVPTSFLRGITFDDCIVLVDEMQNMSFQELDTVLTRVGNNAKVIFCGDIEQNDLQRSKYDTTGLPNFMRILSQVDQFAFVEFQPEDIVRSGLVKDYLLTKRKLGL